MMKERKEVKMRYSHWFWNSRFMNRVSGLIVFLNNYIWSKQYGKN